MIQSSVGRVAMSPRVGDIIEDSMGNTREVLLVTDSKVRYRHRAYRGRSWNRECPRRAWKRWSFGFLSAVVKEGEDPAHFDNVDDPVEYTTAN